MFMVLMSIMNAVSCGMNYLRCALGGGCHGVWLVTLMWLGFPPKDRGL